MANKHDAAYEIRDPIYGFVVVSQAERAVIDSREFQRLRDIRQLAMAHLVYPGATHTRFEHSLGAMHLASMMFDALVERDGATLDSHFDLTRESRPRARQILRLAALLHDVGHPPFSHSGESLLPMGRAEDGRKRKLKHEDMTARIIRESGLRGIIADQFEGLAIGVEDVIAVGTDFGLARNFRPRAFHGLIHTLLTGELGADRIDYLLRDSLHSGQTVGAFDYRRLMTTLRLIPAPETDFYDIGFDAGGWLVAEQMLVARYLMYMSLYFHKTKRIYELHLEEFLRKWLPGGVLPHEVAKYVGLSDSDVLAGIHEARSRKTSPAHDQAMRFRGRGHMRLAREIILADNFTQTSDGRRIPCKKRVEKLSNDVRIKFGTQVRVDEPDHSATKMFEQSNRLLVLIDDTPRYLDDVSEIVRGMSDKIWRARIYAEPNVREDVRAWCGDWLKRHPMPKSLKRGG